jgi:hypothetical protein
MEPEIADRCLTCGAAARPRATFCSQCGATVKPDVPQQKNLPLPVMTNDRAVPNSVGENDDSLNEAPISGLVAPYPSREEKSEEDGGARRARRTKTAALDVVEESLRPHVERIRQVSNVVIDEAAEDASLRFVLIAAVIFIIFLVLLVIGLLD